MKKVIILVAVAVFAVNSFSQNNDTLQNFKHHSIYAELLGNSLFYSVNYDYLFRINKNNIKLAVGTGMNCFGLSHSNSYSIYGRKSTSIEYLISITPEVNFLFGGKSHYFEIGGASMVIIDKKCNRIDFAPSGRIGYRYQPHKGGFLFRVAYTPFFSMQTYLGIHWAGISLGYVF